MEISLPFSCAPLTRSTDKSQGELGIWPFGLLGLGGIGLGTEVPKGLGVLWEMVGGASYSILPGRAPACHFLSL